VACDGPNPERPGEAEKVAATRAVIENEIDWPCQIERLYSYEKQGCRLGVSWFFVQVHDSIMMDKDCDPHPGFFPYFTTLLESYFSDKFVRCADTKINECIAFGQHPSKLVLWQREIKR
jgi:hypothetical protein